MRFQAEKSASIRVCRRQPVTVSDKFPSSTFLLCLFRLMIKWKICFSFFVLWFTGFFRKFDVLNLWDF